MFVKTQRFERHREHPHNRRNTEGQWIRHRSPQSGSQVGQEEEFLQTVEEFRAYQRKRPTTNRFRRLEEHALS